MGIIIVSFKWDVSTATANIAAKKSGAMITNRM
jgi:hypothetical protein